MKWNSNNPILDSARRVVERLRSRGYEAFWVGGCVRDALLGIEPKDIDVATDALPEVVREIFPKNVPVGAHFGVILVLDGAVATEVATCRSDGVYRDGRRPESVVFAAADEDTGGEDGTLSPFRLDALRRDFTINALFYDPVEDRDLDFGEGLKDLDARVLMAIVDPAGRFTEDALRLLRAVRFAIRFDLEIEPLTFQALCDRADEINRISAERIRGELIAILTGRNQGKALRLLLRSGLLKRVLPEVAALDGVPQPENYHPEGDVFKHTALALDAMGPNPSPTLAFAVLLHDVGKRETLVYADRIRFNRHHSVGAEIAGTVCRRLRFSNDDRAHIIRLVDYHMHFMNVQRMRPANLRRLMALDRFDEHLALHRADCLASHGKLDNYDYCKEKLEEFEREDAEPILPPPVISGHDLIARGYRPGPLMGKILGELREAQLNGEVKSAEGALEWVARRYPPDAEL